MILLALFFQALSKIIIVDLVYFIRVNLPPCHTKLYYFSIQLSEFLKIVGVIISGVGDLPLFFDKSN